MHPDVTYYTPSPEFEIASSKVIILPFIPENYLTVSRKSVINPNLIPHLYPALQALLLARLVPLDRVLRRAKF